jgi:hypothetical protein
LTLDDDVETVAGSKYLNRVRFRIVLFLFEQQSNKTQMKMKQIIEQQTITDE